MTNNYNLRGRSSTGLRRWWFVLTGIVLLTVFGGKHNVNAQSITNYAFAASSGTFTPLSGATTVAAIHTDDAASGALPIGFSFIYMGQPYTQLFASSNGILTFSAANASLGNDLNGGTGRPIVAPLWDDLSGSVGNASYLTTGAPGNRVFTFEWLNWRYPLGAAVATISMQAKLYEADGKIEFIYREEPNPLAGAPSASIGLAGPLAGSFLSLDGTSASPTVSSAVETNTIATRPATGQVYAFTPPAAPAAPTSLSFSAVTVNSMQLDWTDATGEIGYIVERSLDGINYTQVANLAANAVTYTATGLSAGTTYYWNIRSYSEGQRSAPLNGNQNTAAGTICGTYSVGPTGTYPSLTAALADIRVNGLSCSAILELQAAYVSSVETFPIWTGSLGTLASKTVTIRPEAGATALSISSSNAWATIVDSLTSYVTIDGRPGGSGTSELFIQNITTTGNAMRLLEESSNNTFQYVSFRGSNTSTANGVVFVGGTTAVGGAGNDNNLFDNCEFRDGAGGLTAVNGFYSLGNTSATNDNNTISNSRVFNIFNTTTATNAINIQGGNTNWTITGNRIYQEASRTYGVGNLHRGIVVNSTLGAATITNNVIGYGSATGTGVYTMTFVTTAQATRFFGMDLNLANAPVSTISGNEIASFSIATSSAGTGSGAPFVGIWLNAGGANITGNTIGSMSGVDNILVRGTTTGGSATTATMIGIAQGAASASAITISNNNIGGLGFNGITAAFANAAGIGATVCGIFNQGGTTLTDPNIFRVISNNTIGGAVANSIRSGVAINAGFTTTANFSTIGILNTGSTRISISNNTVQNLVVPTRSSAGVVYGIHTTTGINNISGNTVHSLTSNSKNVGGTTAGMLAGISHTSTTVPVAGTEALISGNTVRDLRMSSDSSLVTVNGISFTGSTTAGFNYTIQKNLVYNLDDLSQPATDTVKYIINGIAIYGGIPLVQNNMVRLATSITKSPFVNGILKANANINRIYHNSVYIGGAASLANGVLSGNTFGIRRTARPTVGNDEFINNISYNARTVSAGNSLAFAIGLDTNINIVSNKNIFYCDTLSGGRVGLRNTNISVGLANWRSVNNLDLNSIFENPNYVAPAAATPDLHLQASPAVTPAESAGQPVSTTDDFDSEVRAGLTPVDIGADAGNFIASGDYSNPTIYSVSVNPPGGQCAPVAHTVTAVVNDASGISSVTLNWSLNGVAQAPIPMTNTVDSTWEATIAANGTSTVTFSVTVVDASVNLNSSVSANQEYNDAPLAVGFTVGTDQTICPGTSTTLNMVASAIGKIKISEVMINKGGTGDPNPVPANWTDIAGVFPDMIEITNMGANSVNIGGWIVEVRGVGARSYTVPAGVTLDSGQVASFHIGTGTNVPADRMYNMGGTNNSISSGSLSGFIIRNGSTIVDALAINGFAWSGTPAVTAADWTGNVPSSSGRGGVIRNGSTDSNNASDWVLSNTPSPLITWNTRNAGIVIPPSSYTFSWAPGGETTQAITVTPGSVPAQYIGTLSDGVCSYSDTVLVNWFTTLPAPVGHDSTHCGNQLPLCYIDAVPGAIAYRWYTTPTGGTPIQNTLDLTLLQNVAFTDTFWVAAFDGVCDGPRVQVIETVTQPASIDILVTPNDTICLGTVANLNVSTLNPNYTFVWTGNGVGTLNTNTGANVVSTPVAAGAYTFVVTATDAGAGCVITDTLVLRVFNNPNASANIDQTTICAGENVQLNVSGTSLATIGQNDAISSTTSYPSAYGAFYWGHRQQFLLLASELTAAGFTAGPISSLAFDITAAAGQVLGGYTISMAHTAATDMSAQLPVGTVVYGPTNYTSVVGVNTHTFTTPFVWNGTSNIVIETCMNNTSYTTNAETKLDNTSFVSCRWLNQDASGVCAATISSTANQRPMVILNGTSLPSGVTFNWSPAAGLSSTTIPNPVANPTSSTTYVVTVTDPVTGCFTTDTVIINVLPLPAPPQATGSAHCGTKVPTAYVNTVSGASAYYWYDAPTGGNLLQAAVDTTFLSPVGVTSTLYVASFNGLCYSNRVPVTITVSPAPVISVAANDSSICFGESITLTASSAEPNYTYSWTSTGGGGLNSTTGASVTATPIAPGTYSYIVSGSENINGCANTDTVVVVVNALPTVSANISSATVCQGNSVQLDVPSTATIGENDATGTTTGYPSAYGAFYWGYRMQNMIRAAELTAAGFSAGPINGLTYTIATPAGQTLTGYTIKMANVAATDLSVEQTVSTIVYGPVNYNSVIGANTHTFTTPFNWDGVSNVVIETCFNNASYTTNSAGNMDNTSFISSRWLNQDATGVCGFATTATASQRPQMILSKSVPTYTYSWSPAAGLSNPNIKNPVATPLTTTSYVVTVLDVTTGCTNTDTVVINVNPIPAAPVCVNDTVCGQGTVTLTATGGGNELFWTDSIGGNVLAYNDSLVKYVTTSGTDYVREFPANLDTTFVGYNPITNPTAPAGYFPTTSQGMWFRVLNGGGTLIKSVDIYPNGPVGSPIGIAIKDSLGNMIGSVSTVTTVTAPNYQTIDLNIFVPFSTIPYSMSPIASPNLAVHQNATVAATSPWIIPGEVQIIAYGNMPPAASFFGTNTFGMFYNWQVFHGCYGPACIAQYVANPAPPISITPGGSTTFCGSGSVALTATGDPSYVNFNWSPATGLSGTTGASVTASVTSTTTYTVTADDNGVNGCVNSASVTLTVNTAPFATAGVVPDTLCTSTSYQFNGSGGSSSYKYVGNTQNPGQTAGWPFNGANLAQRMQVYVSAAELNAAGIFGPTFLNSVGFQVVSKLSTQPYSNFTVMIDTIPTGFGCFFTTTQYTMAGGTTTYAGNYSTVLGWNDVTFTTPYAWDGVHDIVIQTCFTNATTSFFDIVYTTATPGCNSTNATNAAACNNTVGTLAAFRPNLRFQGGAVNYSWSPATELSSSTISNPLFSQTLGAGPRQYVLTVTDPSNSCTATDTLNFYVSPTPVTPVVSFIGVDTTACLSGSVSLKAVFTDGTLQWQTSTDNITYTDMPGQNNDTLVTPVLSANTWFRVKAYCADSTFSNAKLVNVYNPQVTSAVGDTVCGQGNVTLSATSNPGYFIQWFADSLSSAPLSNSNTFNTFVTQTDTFWVRATVDTNSVFGGGASPSYCTVTNAGSACVTNVTFGAINYNSVGCSGVGNQNIVPEATATTQVVLGQSYTLGVTCDGSAIVSVWIDYNRDGVYAASEWQQVYTTGTTGTITVNIPVTALGGKTGMRIRSRLSGNVNGAGDACLNMGSGETEDFTITIGQSACSSVKIPVIALVTPAPAVVVTPGAATICEGSSVNLDVTSGLLDYTNFDWAPAAGLSSTSGTSVVANPTTTTSYIVTATGNVNGCQASDTVVVTVNPAPTFTLAATSYSVCNGQLDTLSANITSPVSGNYTLTSIPYAPVAPTGPVTVLANAGVAVTPQTGASLDDGTWENLALPPGFAFNYYGNTHTVFNVSTNGFITLGGNLGSNAFCCSGQVIPSAAAPNNYLAISHEDMLLTASGTIDYFTNGTAPNRVFVVRFTAVPRFGGAGGPTTGQIELYETSNIVKFQIGSVNTAAGDATTMGIEDGSGVNASVVAGRNSTSPWIATNEGWQFQLVPAANIVWSGPNIIGANNTPTITAAPLTSSYYVAVVTNPLTGCTKADSLFINASGGPTPDIITNDTSLCNPNFIYVKVKDTGLYSGGYPAGTTFEWRGANGGQITPPVPDLDSISSTNGSSYYVIVTLPTGCVGVSDTAYVTTKSVAVVDSIVGASCIGANGSILATVTSGTAPFHYIWSTDLAQTNIVRNVTKADNKDTLLNLAAGTYYLSVADEAGQPTSCNTGVLTFIVGGSSPIVATATGTNISCNGFADGSATVSWTGGTAPYSILWSDGFTTASRSVFAGGTLTVIVSDLSGCADTASVTINEPAALSLNLSSTPETAPGALNGTATALASGGTPGYTYDWFDAGFAPVGSGSTVGGLAGGTYYYCLVTDTNGCQFNDTIGVITITSATLNLTALIEGYHNGTGGMVPALLNSGVGVSATETDTIRVELRDALSPSTVITSGTAVISTNGLASFTLPGSVIGNSYYIAVFHRNAVQTWSGLPVAFSSTTSYNFTTAPAQAYGSNMIAVLPGVYAFYSGDLAPQDEFIDILDQAVIDNDIFNFASGYVISDLNGDGFVDIIDQAIVDNNIFNFIGSVHP